ncbi:MAG: FKBP-type peptidyl-prolyl cis-trans isomerase [Bacteroidota bacterium]|nr:FKBP-type peptidyl-prolyl cis-trans isomerase [Bacteroidota bacterium]
MNTKISTILTAFILLAMHISGQQQTKSAVSQASLSTPADTLQYTLGAYLGQYINANGFVISNPDLFLKGMNDALQQKKLLVKTESISQKIAEYQSRLLSERNSMQEKQLFAQLKGKDGVGCLPSGVCYAVIKAGTGKRPQPTDTVALQVKGFLPDGKLFEDTYTKNKPYKITPAGLIPGMNEAVQIMPTGSQWRIYIPSALAFGARGIAGIVPPNSAVIFEVELVKIITQ